MKRDLFPEDAPPPQDGSTFIRLTESGFIEMGEHVKLPVEYGWPAVHGEAHEMDELSRRWLDQERAKIDRLAGQHGPSRCSKLCMQAELIAHTHSAVVVGLLAGMGEWGLHVGTNTWRQQWWEAVCKAADGLDDRLLREQSACLEAGAAIYLRCLRHSDAIASTLEAFISQGLERSASMRLAAEAEAEADGPVPPFALTPRFERALMQCARAVRGQQDGSQLPTLVSGSAGCGKTACVLALAELHNASKLQVYMTGETEASVLVGSFEPRGKRIEWGDGVVTAAVRDGKWVVLDNFAEADSCVLERLNP